jgi:hypothetical protein
LLGSSSLDGVLASSAGTCCRFVRTEQKPGISLLSILSGIRTRIVSARARHHLKRKRKALPRVVATLEVPAVLDRDFAEALEGCAALELRGIQIQVFLKER